jgi:hypothetical protein
VCSVRWLGHFTVEISHTHMVDLVCHNISDLEEADIRACGQSTKRKAITDSYNLNRIAEVACEFNVRR